MMVLVPHRHDRSPVLSPEEKAKIVDRIVKLLALPQERRAEAEEAVRDAILETHHDEDAWFRAIRSKQGKASLAQFCRAARLMDAALKEMDAASSPIMFPAGRKEFGPNPDFQQLREVPLAKMVKSFERIIARPSGPVVRDEWWKYNAAREALALMRQFNKKPVTTKGSAFCKIAAALAGEPDADFHHICREVLNADRPSAELGEK